MQNTIYPAVIAHLVNPNARIVVAVSPGYKAPVYGPKDVARIKPEGTGLRIGRTFIFASQIKFARVA